ncbi:MAG TPA: hypothetical protein VNS32_09210, partial [Flavisolibacter sp.]|nr:hypothetical protein [Flavisolibacter sp.]
AGTQASERGRQEYQMLQRRVGLTDIVPVWQYPYYRFIGWILEPVLLFKRILNGIQSPKRVI